jgi:glycosyltransferase involved in cell wall biosynthesis
MGDKPTIFVVGARGVAGTEGGVEKFAEQFVRQLVRSCQVTAICLSEQRPESVADLELVLAPRSRLMGTDKAMYYMMAAWMCVRRRFDHVMLLGINSAMLVLVLRLLFWRRVRIVVRSGSVDYLLEKWGPLSRLYFKFAEGLLRFADLVVAVAPSIQQHLSRRGISSIVIPNGVSLASQPRPLTDREPRHIVAVGRVTAQKNYGLLIEAAHSLRDRGIRATIIGGDDLSGEGDRLRRLMSDKGVSNVTFAGVMERDRVLEYLSRASLFVNCSVHEGMSNSVLEAIQQGAPILLSDIAANRDLDLPNTLYFSPSSAAELSQKIVRALKWPIGYVADRGRFDDWSMVIDIYRRQMNLP